EVEVVVITGRAAAAAAAAESAAALEHVVPMGINGQLFGDVFLPVRHVDAAVRSVCAGGWLRAEVGYRWRFTLVLFARFEHGIAVEDGLNLLLQVQCRQLQQLYRLLQLGRHRQLLTELELKRL